MQLKIEQSQIQTLAPQILQSISILQMDAQEIADYIAEQYQINPVIEMDSPEAGVADDIRHIIWLASRDKNNIKSRGQIDSPYDNYVNRCTAPAKQETLCEHLLAQIQSLKAEPLLIRAAVYIVESLNKNGWLDESISDLALISGFSQETLMQALSLVQNLDPPGVAARNLKESLYLQLERQPDKDSIALAIVENYLNLVAQKHFARIAKCLDISVDMVQKACCRIQMLNPRPGAQYSNGENVTFIVPDIIVRENAEGLEIVANNELTPKLRISSYYLTVAEKQEDLQLKAYVEEKISQAKWVLQAIENRQNTLLSCAEFIVKHQINFFINGAGTLKPLVLADIAENVGIHESTVSRALKGKYIQCKFGVYPLNYFLARKVKTDTDECECTTADTAKHLIKNLIDNEDKIHPLSDQRLSEILNQHGCLLSRRTVAKYRSLMEIPDTCARRLRERNNLEM